MIPVPSGVRIWIATGHTDMRRGMHGLALQVQQGLKRDPHAGDGRVPVANAHPLREANSMAVQQRLNLRKIAGTDGRAG